jgi:hypothetical protein
VSPYDGRMVARAREHREAGWTYDAICNLIAEEHGHRPSRETVIYWTNDAYRQRKIARQSSRERATKGASARVWTRSPEAQAAFVRRLRAEGEPVAGIVRVCRVVFGGRWTRGRVLRLLEDES